MPARVFDQVGITAGPAAALGPAFGVRAFHDRVLGGGALPLDVLEARIDAWIGEQKTAMISA